MAVALAQIGPPASKHPPITAPRPKVGKNVPNTPLPPYRPFWSLALPPASRVTISAGEQNFFIGTDTGALLAYSLADRRQE